MPNVFLIGPGLNKSTFEDILSRNRFAVSKFSSIETALSRLSEKMGQLIIKCLRRIDIVARYGRDQFVVVLPQTPLKAAVQIAERIRKSVERNTFLKKEGYALKMTASFGVASYPESAKTKEDIIRLADEAMYRVKNTTRNGVYTIV
ncbi:MAG: GGDEF domain-containing protein [Thermodesulfovibrionales bacterium]|nr:GGDEF domain-containing protein [Nitrospinota bacterium]MDP3048044.1 GGDEF domain-containing protein [Thermodesulfovibrionales bacterium]